VLTFTPANWDAPQTVVVTALDDAVVDGGDTKVLAPMLHTVDGIQGPLFVDGFGGEGSGAGLALFRPEMLPGETNIRDSQGDVLEATSDTVLLGPGIPDDFPADLTNFTLEITEGPGAGQVRLVEENQPEDGNQRITVAEPWDDGELPGVGSRYFLSRTNPNFLVDEAEQVDLLVVDDGDSVADKEGFLEEATPAARAQGYEARLRGLGMGPDLLIGGEVQPGGITFGAIEKLDVQLGSGGDVVEITDIDDRDDFRTVTVVETGAGDDRVTVSLTKEGVLFSLDTQAGDDVVDASASTLPLVIFGGPGDDEVTGGQGVDLIFGDRGRVDYLDRDPAGNPVIVTRFGDNPGLITGTVTLAAEAALQDPAAAFPTVDDGLVGLRVFVSDGPGLGQSRLIVSNSADALVLDAPWDLPPDSEGGESEYRIAGAPIDQTDGQALPARVVRTMVAEGDGDDTLRGASGEDLLFGGGGGDFLDGGEGRDLVFGDHVVLDRRGDLIGDTTSPRFQALVGETIYGDGEALVDGVARDWREEPPAWANWEIELADPDRFGVGDGDYLAGGPGDDTIFGQQGDDTIQGDGSIESAVDEDAQTLRVEAGRDAAGLLQVQPSFEAASDGDDYVEGNAGDDTILGGLGQDDLVGGSSSLFSLVAPELRADGRDLVFGGAGTDIARNHVGDDSPEGHARDADVILGDNGNVYRLVGTNGSDGGGYLRFRYDGSGTQRLVPRAAELLDYTPGGVDLDPAAAAADLGDADELHGESGDDALYGTKGPDVLFGEGQDDDLIGGYDHDWLSGGTGRDGILGDDGPILTSRNGAGGEPLYGVDPIAAGQLDLPIETNGGMHAAVINVSDELVKTADLEPFFLGGADDPLYDAMAADDVAYGGLGSDSIHGGSGDDAISGAEALPDYYAAPANPGDVLGFGRDRIGEFAAYDELAPLRKILVDETGAFTDPGDPGAREFPLNFDASEGPGDPRSADPAFPDGRPSDGDDKLFGDSGNDWLVGGSGRDRLYGGWGDDLLNADDDHDTTAAGADPRANDDPDTDFTYQDTAFGGAGRDVLIANTGGDRLVDWAGEFNSYLVPFSPFGMPTVSRGVQPALQQFLYDLSASDGADPTRGAAAGDPRNGEPFGEIGLVTQRDAAWRDQHGKPDDPQPGNDRGARDVRLSADFRDAGTAPLMATGSFAIADGGLALAPAPLAGDLDGDGVVGATDILLLGRDFGARGAGLAGDANGDGVVGGADFLAVGAAFGARRDPTAVGLFPADVVATADTRLVVDARLVAEGAGGIVFDAHGSDRFKFAALREDTGEVVIGHYTSAEGFVIDAAKKWKAARGAANDLRVALAGHTARVWVDGRQLLEHSFGGFVVDGATGLLSLSGASSFDSFALATLRDDEEPEKKGRADPLLPLAAGGAAERAARRAVRRRLRETPGSADYSIRVLGGESDETSDYAVRELDLSDC
jgi:Ca2+-binding RTX toxin-like protein